MSEVVTTAKSISEYPALSGSLSGYFTIGCKQENGQYVTKKCDLSFVQTAADNATAAATQLNAAKKKQISIDFGLYEEICLIPNALGALHILSVTAVNCQSISLSHGSTTQQSVTSGDQDPTIAILAGETMTWEITRTDDSARAAISFVLLEDVFATNSNQ